MPRPRHALSTAMRPIWPSGQQPCRADRLCAIESQGVDAIRRHARPSRCLGGTPCSSHEYGEADGRGLRARLFPGQQLDSRHPREKYNRRHEKPLERRRGRGARGPLGPRVYTSRLLGRDKSLVLHGGGNTSVKLREKNLFGEERDVLYVKGSGWDLETIEAAGFAPVPLGAHAEARHAAGAVRPADGQRARTHMLRARRALAFGRDASCTPCCRTSSSTTPTPTRCSRSPTRPTARSASARSTATRVVVIPYVMAGLRPRRATARASSRSRPANEHHRHGAALARHLLLRRRRARVLRAHDRAGVDGRGATSQKQERLAPRSVRAKPASAPSARRSPSLRRAISRRSRASDGPRHASRRAKFLAFAQHPEVAAALAAGPGDARSRASAPSPCRCSGATSTATRRPTARISSAMRRKRASARPCSTRRRAWSSIPQLGFAAAGRDAREARDRRGDLRPHAST